MTTVEFQHWHVSLPDRIPLFEIATTTDLAADTTGEAGMSQEDIDAFMQWLRSDSLDWEGVERRDAWRA